MLKQILLTCQLFLKHSSDVEVQQIQLVGGQCFKVIRHDGPHHDRDDKRRGFVIKIWLVYNILVVVLGLHLLICSAQFVR